MIHLWLSLVLNLGLGLTWYDIEKADRCEQVAICWQHILGVTLPLPNDSWDSCQQTPATPIAGVRRYRRWMDGWMETNNGHGCHIKVKNPIT